MPTAYHRTSRLLPAGTPVWPRSLGRLHRARSRLCLTRGFIGPGTQKIAWDSIWGDLATEADALEGREPEFSLSAQHSSERTLPWICLPSQRILRTASKRSQHAPRYRLPFVSSIFTATSFSSTA